MNEKPLFTNTNLMSTEGLRASGQVLAYYYALVLQPYEKDLLLSSEIQERKN